MTQTLSGKKLGKHAARHDPRTPKLRDHLTPELLSYPAKQDWISASLIRYWAMMLNDTLGDCVIASKGHLVLLWTTLAGKHNQVLLPDPVILAGYEAVGGYVPGEPQTDQGCDMLTAAQYFQQTGLGGHRVSGYASVESDPAHIRAAINAFGAVDIGLAMPAAWGDLESPGDVWDVDPQGSWAGDWAPGSLGGHDVPLMSYDSVADVYGFVTWGQVQYITGRALRMYCDERYAYLSPDWVAAGVAPNKYNLSQLQNSLGAATAKALPKFNWPGFLVWVKAIGAQLGPAAVPLIEAAVARLPLTPAQVRAIDILVEATLTVAA